MFSARPHLICQALFKTMEDFFLCNAAPRGTPLRSKKSPTGLSNGEKSFTDSLMCMSSSSQKAFSFKMFCLPPPPSLVIRVHTPPPVCALLEIPEHIYLVTALGLHILYRYSSAGRDHTEDIRPTLYTQAPPARFHTLYSGSVLCFLFLIGNFLVFENVLPGDIVYAL